MATNQNNSDDSEPPVHDRRDEESVEPGSKDGESSGALPPEENGEPVPGNGDSDVDPDAETIANVDGHLQAGPDEETYADSDEIEGGIDVPKPSDVSDDYEEVADTQDDEEILEPEEVEQVDSLGDLTGRTLAGRYKLIERIGGGGMGEVYRAEHTLIKKQVAIKLLYPELAGESVIERFRREAQASAHIDHPNICASTDFGETDDGIFFLVMEYLDGVTLDEMLDDNGVVEPARAIHIARQICAALEQADELDIIHRDLKPENVMLVRRGSDEDFVKLLDFGIARVRMGQEAKLTQTGMVFGTPNFMSPEQAAGDPMDHRADLYAVGLLLFQMLTGRPPFQAERGSQVMAMHVSQEPPAPSTVSSQEIPEKLESLVLDLLEKEPGERPQTATEVRESLDRLHMELEGVRRGRPADRSSTSIDRTQRLPGDHAGGRRDEEAWLADWETLRMPWPVAVAGALLAMVLGAGAAVGVDFIMGQNATTPPTDTLTRSESSADLGPLEREYRQFLRRPAVREAMQAYRSGSNQTAIDRLEQLMNPTETQPHLHHQLGKLYADNGDWTKSMRAYRTSVGENPQFLSDPELINDVFTAFQLDDETIAKEARRLLAQYIHRERIQRRLVDLAWKDDAYLTRERAHDLLRQKGVVARLPAWERLSIELRHAMGCNEHSEVIERLVQLGDERGLRVLRMYSDMPKSGCGPSNEQDCYGCIRDDLRQAIAALKGRPAAGKANRGDATSGGDPSPDVSGSVEPNRDDVTQSSSSKSSP